MVAGEKKEIENEWDLILYLIKSESDAMKSESMRHKHTIKNIKNKKQLHLVLILF